MEQKNQTYLALGIMYLFTILFHLSVYFPITRAFSILAYTSSILPTLVAWVPSQEWKKSIYILLSSNAYFTLPLRLNDVTISLDYGPPSTISYRD